MSREVAETLVRVNAEKKMFTVALIGPDGAGKTTIARRLEQAFPLPTKYVYMGVNADSSNYLLPTTRVMHGIKRALGAKPDTSGPRDLNWAKPRTTGPIKRLASSLKSSLRLVNWVGEEWYRQALAWYYQHKGYIVLSDRHFFSDYYAYDIANGGGGQPLDRRIHGLMLLHVFPKPDLVIDLDAPPEVLFARKGEGTIESLQRRRREYLAQGDLAEHFVIVNAAQSEDDVARAVSTVIWNFYISKTGDKMKMQDAHP
jgi:thymidylate kinase